MMLFNKRHFVSESSSQCQVTESRSAGFCFSGALPPGVQGGAWDMQMCWRQGWAGRPARPQTACSPHEVMVLWDVWEDTARRPRTLPCCLAQAHHIGPSFHFQSMFTRVISFLGASSRFGNGGTYPNTEPRSTPLLPLLWPPWRTSVKSLPSWKGEPWWHLPAAQTAPPRSWCRSGSDVAGWLPRSRCWFCPELALLEWFSNKSFSSAFSYQAGCSRSGESLGVVPEEVGAPEVPLAAEGEGVGRGEAPPPSRDRAAVAGEAAGAVPAQS